MIQFLSGGILIGSFVCCMFFFRAWRQTGDRFFLMFGLAFALLTAERIALGTLQAMQETRPEVYLLRLAAFTFIIFAIMEQNRSGSRGPRPDR